jgi:ATP-dependent Lon protease
MTSPLPESIPLVILENKVLLPFVVTKVIVRGREASTLTRKIQAWQDKRQDAYVGFVPLLAPISPKADDQLIDNGPSEPSAAPLMPLPIQQSATEKNNLVENMHKFGCLARVLRVERIGFGGYAIFAEGVSRFRVQTVLQDKPHILAKVEHFVEQVDQVNTADTDLATQITAFRELSKSFVEKMRDLQLPDPLIAQLSKIMDNSKPGVLANILVSVIETTYEEKLQFLSTTAFKARLVMTNEWMTRQLHVRWNSIMIDPYTVCTTRTMSNMQVLKISQQIHSNIEGKLSKKQREYYLRQQVREGDFATVTGITPLLSH